MVSHMGVQTYATERNSQIEFLIGFILARFAKDLQTSGQIAKFGIEHQKQYVSNIASDVWDHQLTLASSREGGFIELWCQTTCYKGNQTGQTESNKTYEVRETLVEAIALRELIEKRKSQTIRTIHFTVGDKNYTYPWFLDLKAATFDRSFYINGSGYDIFSEVLSTLVGTLTETDKERALAKAVDDNNRIGQLVRHAVSELLDWYHKEKLSKNPLADLQWGLVKKEGAAHLSKVPNLSLVKGLNIKGRVNEALFGDIRGDDPLIPRTAAKILKKKPFLSAAINIVADWPAFVEQIENLAAQTSDFEDFLRALWDAKPPSHLVLRRILLRIHSDEAITYIQDREIAGITEHNLYSGTHNKAQINAICSQIKKDLSGAGISNTTSLVGALTGNKAKGIVNAARWFEAKNGTELKPSFDYVLLALESNGFSVVTPADAKLSATGYHSELSSQNVRPYTNLKVVLSPSKKPLCFLKAKYFREQEFPRRCKEEAFVGLTLKYRYTNGNFVPRHKIPLVMFIDMASDFVPPVSAIKRLVSFGWDISFSIDGLVGWLNQRSQN